MGHGRLFAADFFCPKERYPAWSRGDEKLLGLYKEPFSPCSSGLKGQRSVGELITPSQAEVYELVRDNG